MSSHRRRAALVLVGIALAAGAGCSTTNKHESLPSLAATDEVDRSDATETGRTLTQDHRLAGGNPHAMHPETREPLVTEGPRVAIPEASALRAATDSARELPVPCRLLCAFVIDDRVVEAPERLDHIRAALDAGDLLDTVAGMRPPAEPPTGPLTIAALATIARELGHDALLLLVTRPLDRATEGISILVDARDATVISVSSMTLGSDRLGAADRQDRPLRLALERGR